MTDEQEIQPEVTPDNQPAPEPIKFTEEQQRFIDETLIPRVQGRAARDLRAQLTETKTKLSRAESALKAASPDSSQLERLTAERDLAKAEAEAVRSAAAEQARNVAIEAAASRANVIDPALLRKVVSDRIQRKPDGSYEILDDAGTPTELTLDQFIQQQADARPYLVRGQVKTGTGSSGSAGVGAPSTRYELTKLFGPGSDASAANRLALSDPVTYRRLRSEAQRKGLVN